MRKSWYWLCRYVLYYVPPSVFTNLVFLINCVRLQRPYYWINLRNPKTFTEKLNWLKYLHQDNRYSRCADKYAVREYVSTQVGAEYLIPLLGVFSDPEQIQVADLPDSFVLKATHGSGWNILINDKSKIDLDDIKNKFHYWLNLNPYYLSREWQYKDIKPRIICEQYLGNNMPDYKFFCFQGSVKFIQVDVDRFKDHKRNFFDVDWNLLNFEMTYPRSVQAITRPEGLERMIQVCKKLAAEFIFIRVDLYYHDQKIFFGELTFFPEGGVGPFDSYNSDLQMGANLMLSQPIR